MLFGCVSVVKNTNMRFDLETAKLSNTNLKIIKFSFDQKRLQRRLRRCRVMNNIGSLHNDFKEFTYKNKKG